MRARLLAAFLIVIIAALGTVLLVSNYSTSAQVRGYLRRSMNENSMMFAEELNSYYHERGSWSGVDSMFMESGEGNSMMGENSSQTGGQHQGQGAGQSQGQGAGSSVAVIRNTGFLADKNGKIIYANELFLKKTFIKSITQLFNFLKVKFYQN